jgi:hypothetical protein
MQRRRLNIIEFVVFTGAATKHGVVESLCGSDRRHSVNVSFPSIFSGLLDFISAEEGYRRIQEARDLVRAQTWQTVRIIFNPSEKPRGSRTPYYTRAAEEGHIVIRYLSNSVSKIPAYEARRH